MCTIASFGNFIGSREYTKAAERPVRLQVGWEKAGEGNSDDPAQARMQVSIHVQSGGATVGPAGARSNPHAFADTISSHNTLECGRNASVPDDLRAAETAFVHLCRPKWATVDTTQVPVVNACKL